MAASTWFHGSAWPPGNHGIMPDGQLPLGDGVDRGLQVGGGDDAGDVDAAWLSPSRRGLRA